MANIQDLFKGQRINKLQTGAIAAHVNHLVATDADFKAKLQGDPIGVLVQFGLSRKVAAALIGATIAKQRPGGAGAWGDITGCCCTGSITIKCGGDFYNKLPNIDDVGAWTKLAAGR